MELDIKKILDNIKNRIAALEPEAKALTLEIHDNPEIGNQEFKACALQTAFLEKHGFTVEKEFLGLKTAYKACYTGKKPGPKIGFLAEFDDLPEIGHACGHNLICMTSIAAAIAMKESADEYGGEICVFGTPAEETAGAKVLMSNMHAFDNMDAVMIGHPGPVDMDYMKSVAMKAFQVEFFGKAAHAAASPEEGINALDAMISFFNAVGLLRQQTKSDVRIHGIIAEGGVVPNIIPDYTRAYFYARANLFSDAEHVTERIRACAEGAAIQTGCTMKLSKYEEDFKDSRNNLYLANMITETLESSYGKQVVRAANIPAAGSSDVGNVSYCCPCVQVYMNIFDDAIPLQERANLHTPEFAVHTRTDMAIRKCLDYSETFALIGTKLLAQPEYLEKIKAEFKEMQ